jgi:hypothetical protein
MLSLELLAASERRFGRDRCAVELFVPRGARFDYGLLGCEFAPASDGRLLIDVAVSSGIGEVWRESLAGVAGATLHGLPPEFAEHVLNSPALLQDKEALPAGRLVVNRAAYSPSGTSRWVIEKLVTTLINLMSLGRDPLFSEEIIAAFPPELQP